MKYYEYLQEIEDTYDLQELSNIAEIIRHDKNLTKKQKITLMVQIGRKRLSIANPVEIYYSEVDASLRSLTGVDSDLFNAIYTYLKDIAPDRYTSINTLRKHVLPYIVDFVRYLVRTFGTLTIKDLDVNHLKSSVIHGYLTLKSKSKYTQRLIYNFISVFGKWLEQEYPEYIRNFPKLKIVMPKAPPSVREKRKMGKPRTLKELDKIFSVVSIPTPRVERKKLPIFKYFFLLLLQTGMRPYHAKMIRLRDLNGELVNDVFGRKFIKINSFDIVEREKSRIGEIITKKIPPPYAYLSENLCKDILNYADKYGIGDDEYVCPIPIRTLQKRASTVAIMSGVVDFSLYDFRDTWASVIYNASGYDISLVSDMGGWSSSQIPVDIYAKTMRQSEAIQISKKYDIYLPEMIKEKIGGVISVCGE